MKRIWGCLLLAAAALYAQSPQELFQKALVKERSEGKLQEAIQLYQQAAQSAGRDRALAAKALLQAGECYQKLGNAESRKLYDRVVRDYADQTATVAIARARLSEAAPPPHGEGMRTRQVWADALDNEGAPSPDGRYLSFVDWETGDLAIRDLTTGENRRLTDKGPWSASNQFALYSVFSPDAKQLVYSWYNDVKPSFWDLRVVSTAEGQRAKPRVLYASKDGELVYPFDWSRDGKEVLVLISANDLTHKIAMISVADGAVRTVKTLDWRKPSRLSLSLDGRYIAYDFPPKEDSLQRDVYVLAADGSGESAVVQSPANDYAPIWTPDGSHILFTSDRNGSAGEWILPVAGGKAHGVPDLLRTGMAEAQPMGFSRNGSLFYSVRVGNAGIYTAELDPATGKLTGAPPKALTERFSGLNRGADWSPDGKLVAYASTRSLSVREPGSTLICIRSTETGDQRELRPDLSYFQAVHWAPDGKSLTVWGSDRKGRKGVFEIDASTGRLAPMVVDEADPRGGIWSPDRKYLYYLYQNNGRIVRRDVAAGREDDVVPASRSNRFFALSPDGSRLAIFISHPATKSQAIAVVPSSGGAPREIEIAGGPPSTGNVLDWTRDGKFLLFGYSQGKSSQLWRVPAEGGRAELLGTLPMGNANTLRLSPDGRRISFAAGTSTAEIWEMSNFLTAAAKQ